MHQSMAIDAIRRLVIHIQMHQLIRMRDDAWDIGAAFYLRQDLHYYSTFQFRRSLGTKEINF